MGSGLGTVGGGWGMGGAGYIGMGVGVGGGIGGGVQGRVRCGGGWGKAWGGAEQDGVSWRWGVNPDQNRQNPFSQLLH
jgi:hypothetical protein